MSKPDQKKWVRSNREATIYRSIIEEWQPDSLLYPKSERLSDLPADNRIRSQVEKKLPIWCLMEYTKTGLDSEGSSFSLFPTKEDAENAMRPNGTSFDEEEYLKPKTSEFKVGVLSSATLISASGMRGEPPYELIYEALHGAGVYENFGLSRLVLDWLGDDGCDWLKTEYGENWECVAILEYCTVHFPSSALVTLAARILVADFVSNNGFDAGYASRELIMLASGTEEAAILATNTRKKAGESGARASRDRRLRNLELLMQEIEQLSDAVGLISEERIVDQALEKTVARQKDFPKSQKTHAAYGTALRSEEPFKSRYEAVFRKNT